MKVLNSLNYDYKMFPGEENKLPSETVPDQTMSIKEILQRYARGLSYDNVKVPVYDEEDYYQDVRKMDLTEIHEEMQDIRKRDRITKQKQQYEKDKATALPGGNQTKIRTGTADTSIESEIGDSTGSVK